MSLRDMEIELGSDYHVQQTIETSHPNYASPVRITRFGWANKKKPTRWYQTLIEPIKVNKLNTN